METLITLIKVWSMLAGVGGVILLLIAIDTLHAKSIGHCNSRNAAAMRPMFDHTGQAGTFPP